MAEAHKDFTAEAVVEEQVDLFDKTEESTEKKISVDNSLKEESTAVEEPEGDSQEAAVVEPPSAALQKQIDALRKSEEIQRARADQAERDQRQALQRVNEQTSEVSKFRKEAYQAQYDSVTGALTSAQSEAESAKRDIKNAIINADVDAQTDAYERLAIARSNISRLEDGKYELEARLKAQPEKIESVTQQDQQQDTTPDSVKEWISRHPDYMQNTRKNDKLRNAHWDSVEAGNTYGTQDYIDFIDTRLGFKQAAKDDNEEVVQRPVAQQQRTSIVSAPVSREVPSTFIQSRDSKIDLSPAQREAAKISGISEKVYAESLLKMNRMKANGTYGERQ